MFRWTPMDTIKFLRLPAVLERRGRGRSQHYVDIAEGIFVPPLPLGPGAQARGYPEHEVQAMNAAVLAGKSKAELRELVAQLVAARKIAA
jgi:prophage regulatory protein